MDDLKIVSKKEAIENGLTRYFSGKPCPKGHVGERYTSGSTCVLCGRLSGKIYRDNNVEKEKERSKNKYTPQERKIKYDKERDSNPEAILTRGRKGRKLPKPSRPCGEVCEICGNPETQKRNGRVKMLALDHCHNLNVFRGWICSRCNMSLGLCKDSPELLRKMAEYLEDFKKKNV